MKKVVIIGAGGLGREVAAIIENNNKRNSQYQILGFLDDGENYSKGTIINGYPWLGKVDWILNHKEEAVCACAIAEPRTKELIMKSLTEQGVAFETILDAHAYVHSTSEVGPGCIIYAGVMISSNCKIGAGVLVNSYVTVGHDVEIGNYSYVMPSTGISGYCKIGERARIGGHSFIIPGKKVGEEATVSAGSVVFTNVKPHTTVLGNPAKRMKELE